MKFSVKYEQKFGRILAKLIIHPDEDRGRDAFDITTMNNSPWFFENHSLKFQKKKSFDNLHGRNANGREL